MGETCVTNSCSKARVCLDTWGERFHCIHDHCVFTSPYSNDKNKKTTVERETWIFEPKRKRVYSKCSLTMPSSYPQLLSHFPFWQTDPMTGMLSQTRTAPTICVHNHIVFKLDDFVLQPTENTAYMLLLLSSTYWCMF